MAAAPLEQAMELRTELVEILKHLNRAEMEEGDVNGLEVDELRHFIARAALPGVTHDQIGKALEVLVGNGLARELSDPRYAWDRGRVVSDRFTITVEGKAFLVRQLQRVGRI
jgi:hypothetical protein